MPSYLLWCVSPSGAALIRPQRARHRHLNPVGRVNFDGPGQNAPGGGDGPLSPAVVILILPAIRDNPSDPALLLAVLGFFLAALDSGAQLLTDDTAEGASALEGILEILRRAAVVQRDAAKVQRAALRLLEKLLRLVEGAGGGRRGRQQPPGGSGATGGIGGTPGGNALTRAVSNIGRPRVGLPADRRREAVQIAVLLIKKTTRFRADVRA